MLTSIILPFYKKMDLFRVSLPLNRSFFAKKDREVVIAVDYPPEVAGLLDFIKDYPDIKFRILVNPIIHEWQNPAIVLNTAIHHAIGGYIFVMSPESVMKTDVIGQLVDVSAKYNDFACGFVNFVELKEDNTWVENDKWLPYGSICFPVQSFYLVGGYSTKFVGHGCEDDQLRMKFKLLSCEGLYIPSAQIFHLERGKRKDTQASEASLQLLRDVKLKDEFKFDENFKIVYDYISK